MHANEMLSNARQNSAAENTCGSNTGHAMNALLRLVASLARTKSFVPITKLWIADAKGEDRVGRSRPVAFARTNAHQHRAVMAAFDAESVGGDIGERHERSIGRDGRGKIL